MSRQVTKLSIRRDSKGFTIIELLLATTIFSIVLLLVASAMVQIASVYYKGVTNTNTQNVARNVTDALAQAIQFNGGTLTVTPATPPAAGTSTAFCIGGTQYAFQLGYELSDSPVALKHQAYHVLVQNNVSNCSSAGGVSASYLKTQTLPGTELLNANMRLSKMSLQQIGTTDLYKLDVRVVYGDDDLLSNPTAANATCASVSAGSQYCSVSELSTIVSKRVD